MHPFGVGTSPGWPWIHLTHHGPDSGEATTFPHIVFFALLRGTCIQMAFIPRTPKEESWNCPGLDSQNFGNSQLPAQTSDWDEVWSKLVALLKSFPTVYRTPFAHTGIGSIPDFLWSRVKTISLTHGPSFAHNLCGRCPNGSCKAIFDIFTSRPFQRYKEDFKARCFAFCCWALKLQES